MSGATVTLIGGGADGVIGTGGDDTTATTTTGANGAYAFTGLFSATQYQVQFSLPSGYGFTVKDVGGNGFDTIDSDVNPATGKTQIVTLVAGENNTTLDAGVSQPASLGDRLWVDTNGDGIQNDGATGLIGQTVTLIGGGADGLIATAGDNTTTSTTTGVDGAYQFTGLTPGAEYQVQFAKPSGYSFTVKDASGNTLDATDSDADATGKSQIVTLTSGQYTPTIDAGLVQGSIDIDKDTVGSVTSAFSGAPVTFTYKVTNPGLVALSNIVVKDDNATPSDAGDDFNPTRLADLVGNNDNILGVGEVWQYSATVIPAVQMTVTVAAGATPIDSGTLSYKTVNGGDIQVFYRQSANFNDNTYGTGSDSGWTSQGRTHTFGDLTGSDKAGFEVKDGNGTVLFKFYQDYITSSTTNVDGYTSYSNYQSLGFSGGDGSYVSGLYTSAQAATYLVDFDSTLETNLNQAGTSTAGTAYTATIVNSPTNDVKWDKVDGYSFTIKAAAFGSAGFGGVSIFDQHNSPAKVGGSNSYVPDIVTGPSTNVATVTAGGGTINDQDSYTIQIKLPPTKFYVVDNSADDVFGYTSGGGANKPFVLDATNTDGRGITGDAANTMLWVLDKNKTVFVYQTDGAALGKWTASDLSTTPEGIALDTKFGQDFWIVDSGSKMLYWYDNAGGNLSGTDTAENNWLLTSLNAANDKPRGITTDGVKLWVVEDDSANTVFVYNITRDGAGTPTALTSAGSWTLDSRNTTPTGITLDPTGASNSLWVVDSGTDTVYEYANAKSLTSGSNVVASKTFLLDSTNLSPQDIFDPLVGSHFDALGATLGNLGGNTLSADPVQVALLPQVSDLVGGDTLDAALGGGCSSLPHGLAEAPQADANGEMGELLRRLTAVHREDHAVASA